jgi:hypothetical protein
MSDKTPKQITLQNIPKDVIEKIGLCKAMMLRNNPHNISVSTQQAIYKLIRIAEVK